MADFSKLSRRSFLALAPAAAIAGLTLSREAGAGLFSQDLPYDTYKVALPTEAGAGKVEVVEFFSYGCPHCHEFDPLFEKWIARQAKDVVVKRVPVTFGRDAWRTLAQVYYALEAIKADSKAHHAVFNAIHNQNKDLTVEAVQDEVLSKAGVDIKQFRGAYKSFSMPAKLVRSDDLTRAYMIRGVPTVTIAGRYSTSGSQAGSLEKLLVVMDDLVAKSRSHR